MIKYRIINKRINTGWGFGLNGSKENLFVIQKKINFLFIPIWKDFATCGLNGEYFYSFLHAEKSLKHLIELKEKEKFLKKFITKYYDSSGNST